MGKYSVVFSVFTFDWFLYILDWFLYIHVDKEAISRSNEFHFSQDRTIHVGATRP